AGADTGAAASFGGAAEVVGAGGERPIGLAFRMAGSSPAGGGARLSLDQPAAGFAAGEVYDVRGARVRTLWQGALAAGRHALSWDGRCQDGGPAPAGIYLVRARSGAMSRTLRVAFLR